MRVSHDDIARQNQRRAHELVEALICGGVRDAVISPGSRNTPLVLAFAEAARQQDSMAIHTVLDERSAAFYALGLSRAGGTPAVLCCTSGSAGGHYLPAIAEAASSGVPMVVITADRPVELQDCGAPQTMNQDRLYGEHVRYYRNLGLPDLRTEDTGFASTAVACALDRAQGMRPGPAHLNQPFRKPLWRELERGDEMAPVRRAKISRGRLEPSGDMIPYLVWRMDESPRGVIVCGPNPGGLGGSALSESHGFSEALLCLADSLGWPILADPLSSLRYGGHRHAAIISTYDAFLADSDVAQALAPQLILHFGRQPTSTALVQWMAQCEQAHTVLVEPSGDWHDPTHCASELLAVDPERLCHHLCERLGDEPPADPHWIGRWQQLETTTRACLNSACEEGLWSGFIASTVVGALPEGAMLHVGSSMPIRDVDSFGFTTDVPVAISANRGLNGIDGAQATALGIAARWPEPVVALIGDLTFLHDLGALTLARARSTSPRTSVTVVVVDNGGGAIFGTLPIAAHPTDFEDHFLTPQDMNIPALCAAADIPCESVDDQGAFTSLLTRNIQSPGMHIIHVVVNREEDRVRRESVRDAICTHLPTLPHPHEVS